MASFRRTCASDLPSGTLPQPHLASGTLHQHHPASSTLPQRRLTSAPYSCGTVQATSCTYDILPLRHLSAGTLHQPQLHLRHPLGGGGGCRQSLLDARGGRGWQARPSCFYETFFLQSILLKYLNLYFKALPVASRRRSRSVKLLRTGASSSS